MVAMLDSHGEVAAPVPRPHCASVPALGRLRLGVCCSMRPCWCVSPSHRKNTLFFKIDLLFITDVNTEWSDCSVGRQQLVRTRANGFQVKARILKHPEGQNLEPALTRGRI